MKNTLFPRATWSSFLVLLFAGSVFGAEGLPPGWTLTDLEDAALLEALEVFQSIESTREDSTDLQLYRGHLEEMETVTARLGALHATTTPEPQQEALALLRDRARTLTGRLRNYVDSGLWTSPPVTFPIGGKAIMLAEEVRHDDANQGDLRRVAVLRTSGSPPCAWGRVDDSIPGLQAYEVVYSPFEADADGHLLLELLELLAKARQAELDLDIPQQMVEQAAIDQAALRWENKLINGYSQYPWEAAINGLIDESWAEPSRWQGIWLHPELGTIMNVEGAVDEELQPRLALNVHLGALRYWGDDYDWYVGLAATGSLAETEGLGYGGSLILGHQSLKASGLPRGLVPARRAAAVARCPPAG